MDMEASASTDFDLTAAALERLLANTAPPFPEFAVARRDLAALRADPRVRTALAETAPLLDHLGELPQTTFTRYRAFAATGDPRSSPLR